MSCQDCGHKAEYVNAQQVQGHNLGCPQSAAMRDVGIRVREDAPDVEEFVAQQLAALACEFGDCTNPKRPQGRGPKPKYCDDHSDPKNRK